MNIRHRVAAPPRRPTGAFILTLVIAGLGVVPLPGGWAWSRSLRESTQSLEPNRSQRDSNDLRYYEGLTNLGCSGAQRNELALRLVGKPPGWVNFHDYRVTEYQPSDPLQYVLKPDLDRVVLDKRFSTNSLGLRDRHYEAAKPPGVFRIVLLGSSIDMGWGVADDETYENLLEDWLNAEAARRGSERRFEVLNFAMAAYSPAQRLEAFRRRALPLDPDMVLYSTTVIDARLSEIHLCNLIQHGVDLAECPYVQPTLAAAALGPDDLRRDRDGQLSRKEHIKRKLRPEVWGLIDRIVGVLAAECRARSLPLYCLVVPRACDGQDPEARAPILARHAAIARHHALELLDLSDSFDGRPTSELEISTWDDHPNALGHRLIFHALAARLATDPALSRALFGTEPGP